MVFGKGICKDWYTANDKEGGGTPCGKGLHLGAGALQAWDRNGWRPLNWRIKQFRRRKPGLSFEFRQDGDRFEPGRRGISGWKSANRRCNAVKRIDTQASS